MLRSWWASFVRGAASLLDLFPAPVRYNPPTAAEAIRSDWEAVLGPGLMSTTNTNYAQSFGLGQAAGAVTSGRSANADPGRSLHVEVA